MTSVPGQWTIEQVLALAPKPNVVVAAQPLAVPTRWINQGCDERAVWGRCLGSGGEPYETAADHVGVAFRCSCPARMAPCKHAVALMMLWVRGQVPPVEQTPGFVSSWIAKRLATVDDGAAQATAASSDAAVTTATPAGEEASSADAPLPPPPDRSTQRDDRVARMSAGLAELDRWLVDRVRTGLADPSLARYATWDELAARLVDAQVGSLANRVRRLAGLVGAHPQWHQQVLAELGTLHLLAASGRHLGSLAPGLADSVAAAIGWQVKQADVRAGVPHTDHWVVAGRSDTREDRIEVRRLWLRGETTGSWAMLLSFAAYGQSLDTSLVVGTVVHADLFRYPGALGLRALVGQHHSQARQAAPVSGVSVRAACNEIGSMIVAEPWIERVPVTVTAAPQRSGTAWVLGDHTGTLPLVPHANGLAALVACSGGAAIPITCEWTPAGLVPLTAHLPDRSIDLGPLADPSFAPSSNPAAA